MATHKKRAALVQWIRSILTQGIILSDTVQHYMEATFGTTDLAAILASETGGELDSLQELLFFPDRDLQIRYESRWGNEHFSTKDLSAIQSLVGQQSLRASIIQPGSATTLTIKVPAFALQAFVDRLNLTWQPAPLIATALERHWPGKTGIRIRVHLRNARLIWHADQIRLMHHFCCKMPPDAEDVEDCLAFLLTLLSELAPQSDPFTFLIAKKYAFFQALCKAEDFDRRRHTSNMEILMLQGSRAAHGSIAQWRQQMRWIDRICNALYGRTHFFQQPDDHCMNLQKGDDAQLMQNIIRMLS